MKHTGGRREHPPPEPQREHVVRIHVVPHVRVPVRCVRLRVSCTAFHVPHAFYMSEASTVNLAQTAINNNANALTCS